ncbi:hypothetical protein J3R73_002478 [Labrys monachus]|uniref:Uncharacterized protein n=1 Tax=Labrys monachus TaxID=217067 RepID=A0ABU0FE31_9HYPH|nr:hypothetical protein [Labrys monachus]
MPADGRARPPRRARKHHNPFYSPARCFGVVSSRPGRLRDVGRIGGRGLRAAPRRQREPVRSKALVRSPRGGWL